MRIAKDTFFLVIEGLDGSGKTEVSRRLVDVLQTTLDGQVKLTFEPHDPSCAGLFIRNVLMRRIAHVPARTVALAFAANRADHCDREIKPFLQDEHHRVVVCDRYYLSSLVYQTADDLSLDTVMEMNAGALRPDLTIYLEASNSVCFERMRRRQQSKELFETNLSRTRGRYAQAIEYLQARGENIVCVSADDDLPTVLNKVIDVLHNHAPDWLVIQRPMPESTPPEASFGDGNGLTISEVAGGFAPCWNRGPILGRADLQETLSELQTAVRDRMAALSFNDLASLFLEHLRGQHYEIGDLIPWSDLHAVEVQYALPGPCRLVQQGAVLLIGEEQRIDIIWRKAATMSGKFDFLFVLVPDEGPLLSRHYEREMIAHGGRGDEQVVSPSVSLISREVLYGLVLAEALDMLRAEHRFSLRESGLDETLRAFREQALRIAPPSEG